MNLEARFNLRKKTKCEDGTSPADGVYLWNTPTAKQLSFTSRQVLVWMRAVALNSPAPMGNLCVQTTCRRVKRITKHCKANKRIVADSFT